MKIIVVILQGLLLGSLSYPQEKCQKEKQQIQYYIYDTNVEIKMHPCIVSEKNHIRTCENYNYRKVVADYLSIIDKCISYNYNVGTITRNDSGAYNSMSHQRIFVTLCELSASAILSENVVKTISAQREYSNGRYYDKTYQHFVFWSTEVCQDIHFVYAGPFDIWTDRSGHKYIRSGQISLRLTEKIYLCDHEMWKTDNDGVIVSTNFIKSSVTGNMTRKLQGSFPVDCENPKKPVENVISHEENVSHNLKEKDNDSPTLLDYLMYVSYIFLGIVSLMVIVTFFLSVRLIKQDPLEIKYNS